MWPALLAARESGDHARFGELVTSQTESEGRPEGPCRQVVT